MNIPNKPVYLSAPATLAVTEGSDIPRQFSGIPYSGGVIKDYGFPLIIDLSTTSVAEKIPVLYEHRRDRVIGVVAQCSVSSNIQASGDIFSDIDEDAREIAEKSKRGVAWQMSVGLFDAAYEEVPPGKSVLCNGIEVHGPISILRNGLLREVSIVSLGADRNTSAGFFSARPGTNQTEERMSENTEISALKAQIEELGAKLREAEDRAAQAENKLNAELQAARKREVESLFAELGKELSAEAATHYLSIDKEAWEFLAKDLRSIAAKGADGSNNAHLFSEQAVGNTKPSNTGINTADIYAARRMN